MTQLERITMMESCLCDAHTVVKALHEALREYVKVRPKLRELEEYYSSEEWRKDFEDDEAGRLPDDLKRGVLSEDGIYNVLEADKELREEMREELLITVR